MPISSSSNHSTWASAPVPPLENWPQAGRSRVQLMYSFFSKMTWVCCLVHNTCKQFLHIFQQVLFPYITWGEFWNQLLYSVMARSPLPLCSLGLSFLLFCFCCNVTISDYLTRCHTCLAPPQVAIFHISHLNI